MATRICRDQGFSRPTAGLAVGALWLMLALAGACAPRTLTIPAAPAPRFDPADYRLVWPLPLTGDAVVTSRYGRRNDPLNGRTGFHTGVDLEGPERSPVHAAGAGRVSYAAWRRGYGLLLVLDHGRGVESWYGHCSRLLAAPGQRVNRGQVVALMGSTGRSSGCHLHFELRRHGRHFDPFLLLPRLRER